MIPGIWYRCTDQSIVQKTLSAKDIANSLSQHRHRRQCVITMDIFRKTNPNASENRLVLIGRIATGVIVAISMLRVPPIQYLSNHGYIPGGSTLETGNGTGGLRGAGHRRSARGGAVCARRYA